MEYGIQRRGVFLRPPLDHDFDWLFRQFENEEIWSMFGFNRAGRMEMLRAYRQGNLVTGVLHTVTPQKRIGFVMMFPPDETRDFWEFSYAIPEPADRDAFSALSSTDAMAHYMFEHLGVEKMGWRVRHDNRAAQAVIRRLGYEPAYERSFDDGKTYTFFTLSRDGWAKRRARLDRGEEEHPSGYGSTFRTLPEHPFAPPAPKRRRKAKGRAAG